MELNLSREQALEKLIEKFQLTDERAEEYLNTCWPQKR